MDQRRRTRKLWTCTAEPAPVEVSRYRRSTAHIVATGNRIGCCPRSTSPEHGPLNHCLKFARLTDNDSKVSLAFSCTFPPTIFDFYNNDTWSCIRPLFSCAADSHQPAGTFVDFQFVLGYANRRPADGDEREEAATLVQLAISKGRGPGSLFVLGDSCANVTWRSGGALVCIYAVMRPPLSTLDTVIDQGKSETRVAVHWLDGWPHIRRYISRYRLRHEPVMGAAILSQMGSHAKRA